MIFLCLISSVSGIQNSLTQIGSGPIVNVAVTPNTIQASNTALIVSGQLTKAIPVGGLIQIIVPSTLSINMQVPLTGISNTCSGSSKTFSIFVNQVVPADSFQVTITNALVQNPQSTTPTATFIFESFDASMNALDFVGSNIILQCTQGSMTEFILSSASQQVGASTSLTVTFKAAHNIPVGSVIIVGMPKWNPNAASPVDYIQGSVSCSTSEILSSSLSCTYSNQKLTVTGAYGAAVTGGLEMAFVVTGFRNPITTQQITGFTILTTDSNGGSIDSGSANLTITQPGTITQAQIISADNTSNAGIVQQLNAMQLSFYLPVPLNPTCIFKVILPSQFSLTTISTVFIFGLGGQSLTTVTFTPSSSDNSFSFTQCPSYTDNSQKVVITINSLLLPNFVKTTGTFQIKVTDGSSNAIAQVTSGITFTPKSGTIPTPALTAANDVILSLTSITFVVIPAHSLDTSAEIVITLPSAFGVSSTCTSTNVLNTGSSQVCSSSTSSNKITIFNFLTSAYISGTTSKLSFTVSGITLPQSMNTQSGYSFVTQVLDVSTPTDTNYYTVDTFSGSIPLTMAPGTLTATVTPSSLIAYQSSIYTFTITPQHQIPNKPSSGYIVITYPSQIIIPDSSSSQSQCGGFVNFPSTPNCVIDTTKSTITINNGFRTSTSPAAGTSFTLTVPGIQNPITLQKTSTFQFQTYMSDGELLDQLLSGVTIQMTQSAVMSALTVIPSSLVNAAINSYTIQITPTIPVTSSNTIIVTYPVEIKLPTSSSSLLCGSEDTSLIGQVTCSLISNPANSVQVTLSLVSTITQINILQTFEFKMNMIMNPNSTAPSSQFKATIQDASGNIINTSPTGVTVQMSTPYTLSAKTPTITANNSGPGQPAKYNITFYPEHSIAVNGGIFIQYPSQVSVLSTTNIANSVYVNSSYTTQAPTVTFNASSRQIFIKNAFQFNFQVTSTLLPVSVILDGFQNPTSASPTTSFIVKTMNIVNGNYYYIDQINNGLILNSACNYPCQSCSSSNPSNCTSCYNTSALNKLQGGTCVQDCASGSFFNSTIGACQTCSSPCLTCNNSATNCTSCGIGANLFLYNYSCQSTCPNGYLANTQINQCQLCDPSCQTCSISTKSCTSCNTSSSLPYLYQSSCLGSCPVNITIPSTGQCNSCTSNCATCSMTTSNCTSCPSYMKFDPLNFLCINECSQGTQIYNQAKDTCDACSSNCQTCTGNTTTCTSCASSLVLNTDNVCRSQCSSSDQIALSGQCQQCKLPCAQCKGALTHCTLCQGDYLLYNTTCVQYCPEKYEPSNDTSKPAQCILVGLICPSGFTINEAGDGCIPNEIECPNNYILNRDKSACVPGPGSPVPFPFLFLSIMLGLLVFGSWLKDKFFTKVPTSLLALLGLQEILMYLLMIGYSGAMELWAPFALSLIAFLCLITANIVFYVIYKKEIVLRDEAFAKWCRLFPKTTKYIPLLILCVNFKAIKFYYSGFFGLESCIAQFDNPPQNLFRPLKMLTYFSFIFVYIPIVVADIIIWSQVKWGYQLLVLSIETFLLVIAVVSLTYMEFRRMDHLILRGNEQYTRIKPKSFINDTMVMSGIVDVDETTLVRGKVVDDDYEIFLRKKAFVSVINQVKKNYETSTKMGFTMGGSIEQIMSKFDEKQLKLRRAFSMEEIKEEDSWVAEDNKFTTKGGPTKDLVDEEEERMEYMRERRHSYPMTQKKREEVQDPQFKRTLMEIKQAEEEQLEDNVYADVKAPSRENPANRKKTVSRRTQTYLRELLQMDDDDMRDSDLEVILEDEAEIDADYAHGLIDGVLDGISETESNATGKRRGKKKRKVVPSKRTKEIPDFELADIMGDFEIDDLGNFIILRGEKGELLDKKERRVNRRGYLIDRFGNIINKAGQVIFKAVELDSDDEIPAPYGFEKRKKNLLNLGQDGEFKVEGHLEKQVEDDEDLIDKELKQMRKSMKKTKKKQLPNGQVVEEEVEDDDVESSIDSLMAESPGKYQIDQNGDNEDEILANVTKKKVPLKRGAQKGRQISPGRGGDQLSPVDSIHKKSGPMQNLPPRRIKKEDTKEMFPSLNIEGSEQKKLFKIAEQIGGMATQIVEQQKRQNLQSSMSSHTQQNQANQERLERLKQDHFKDIMSENKQGQPQRQGSLPPKGPHLDKIYGNLGDIVNYEEQQMKDAKFRAQSPFSSHITSRMGGRGDTISTIGGDKRRLRGLESIYLQKFDKKLGAGQHKKNDKAKFRNTLNQFVDDPELLLDDGIDRQKQQEMSVMIADKLDRLQRQYMNNTATNKFSDVQSQAIMPTVGAVLGKRAGSISRSILNQDSSLEPIKKGNWVARDTNL